MLILVGCVGVPGRSSRSRLGGEDCGVGGGGPRREKVEQRNQRSPQQTWIALASSTCDAITDIMMKMNRDQRM